MSPRRAAQVRRPYGGCRSGHAFFVGAGPSRPADHGSAITCSVKPGTGVSELCPSGRSEGYEIRDDEVARQEFRPATQILRAGNPLLTFRYASPVMGSGADSPCQGEMARRARGGRVGDYEHEVLIRSRPRRRFGDFAAAGKVTRRPQAAKLPKVRSKSQRKPHLCRIKKIYLKSRKKMTRMWKRSLTIRGESGIVDSTNKNNSC